MSGHRAQSEEILSRVPRRGCVHNFQLYRVLKALTDQSALLRLWGTQAGRPDPRGYSPFAGLGNILTHQQTCWYAPRKNSSAKCLMCGGNQINYAREKCFAWVSICTRSGPRDPSQKCHYNSPSPGMPRDPLPFALPLSMSISFVGP